MSRAKGQRGRTGEEERGRTRGAEEEILGNSIDQIISCAYMNI